MSWFYMNSWQGQDVRTLASNEELVFRVPKTWLAQNALSCVEYTVNGKELSRDGESFRAWAFLTPLVVPLAFRIVDSTPLKNEDARKMSNAEVASVLYMAHSAADSSSRDERVYNVTPAAEPPSEDGALQINPF